MDTRKGEKSIQTGEVVLLFPPARAGERLVKDIQHQLFHLISIKSHFASGLYPSRVKGPSRPGPRVN